MTGDENFKLDLSKIEIDPIETVEQLRNPICRATFDFWSKLPAPKLLQTQHFLETPEVVPFVVVLDWNSELDDFVFRFVGQMVIDISKQDLTGQPLIGSDVAPLTVAFCKAFQQHRCPLVSKINYSTNEIGTSYLFDETILIPGCSDVGNDRIAIAHGISS